MLALLEINQLIMEENKIEKKIDKLPNPTQRKNLI